MNNQAVGSTIRREINTVLIIDDDPSEHFILKRGFKKHINEEQILAAMDGQEALTLLEEVYEHAGLPPAIILCDINMPRINGLEFLKQFKAFPYASQSHFVLWSTSERASERQRALELSVDEFVVKPRDLCDLFKLIECWSGKLDGA